MWPALGVLTVHSSICYRPVKISSKGNLTPKANSPPLLPPLPPSLPSPELHPSACEPDHLNTKQRNKGVLKIEMLSAVCFQRTTLQRERENRERMRGGGKGKNKKERKTAKTTGIWWANETLYWCRIGGQTHWFPASSSLVMYGWFVIQSRLKHGLWTCPKPGFTGFSVSVYTQWIIMLPLRMFSVRIKHDRVHDEAKVSILSPIN